MTVHIIGYSCPTFYMHNASKPIYNSYYTSKISEEKKLQENTCKSLQVLEVCIHNNNLSRQNVFCFMLLLLFDSLQIVLHQNYKHDVIILKLF